MNTRQQKIGLVSIDAARMLLILLFVYAAMTKLMVYNKFIVQIGLSPLLPNFITPVAWLIPVSELIISLLLVFHKTIKWGLYGSAFLMLSFTLYIAGILTVADHVPCSCGGVLEYMSWSQHLVFNIVYLLLALAGIYFFEKNERYNFNSIA